MAWLKRFFRNRDESLEREIEFHIAKQTEANIARGMSPEEARRQALIDFGGREQMKQSVREVHVWALFEAAKFNLKSALRFMRRSPSFSLAVILTLALGIGANSAVFSAIDAIVLRSLPFPDGDRLVRMWQHDTKYVGASPFVAPVRLEDWNRLASTFQGITGYYLDDLSELSRALPEKVTEALVAPRFLQVLGVSPALGRSFTREEERWGGPNAVIISYGFWQRRFQGDPAALGKKLHVGSYYYPIVGVMPASFQFPTRAVDIWAPSPPDPPCSQRRDASWFTVIAPMKQAITVKQATADLETV